MPVYDYNCSECLHTFEQRELIANVLVPTTQACPQCGKVGCVSQTITCPAIVDSVRIGITKPPSDFQKYVLGRIKHSVPGNKIGEKHSITKEL